MKISSKAFALTVSTAFVTGLLGCNFENTAGASNRIVGTWLVKDFAAPFPYHMYVFNDDGTMQQANPDAGDPRTSDSDGKGVWIEEQGRVKGKWMEVVADRSTHKFAGRVEVSFDLGVDADTFKGTESVRSFDGNGTLTASSARPTPLAGGRVTVR